MSGTLSIATRALLIAQRALEVTSHNMANVNTEGFSRQKLELATATPYPTSVGQVGTGVAADIITRMFDAALNRGLIEKTSILARYDTEKSSISQIETIFNESYGSGLNKVMSDFWNAWQEVVNNPEGSAERISLLEKSQSLVNTITTMRRYLDDHRAELNISVEHATKEINNIAIQIADLNGAITKAEANNRNANDLRDQRNLLLR
ncbi:MAG: flagellar hook-associated protein FlgK, partial [Deltaproteobacteria bacterium]|nr:flagellar hook-associated protein FlgK [Deltaproteobacteria bacterium]